MFREKRGLLTSQSELERMYQFSHEQKINYSNDNKKIDDLGEKLKRFLIKEFDYLYKSLDIDI